MLNKPLYIDIHVLQTVPPSCINRDDTGSPKTARFGNTKRARVSSQAWKKAIRDWFEAHFEEGEIGFRTKHAVELIAGYIKEDVFDKDHESIFDMAEQVLKATGIKVKDGKTGYLVFVSPMQAKELAALAVDAYRSGNKVDAKRAKEVLNVREKPTLNSVDIALFGRMVADVPILNVDATTQVAHAIGVGPSEQEYDYYTALDDCSPQDSAGAGMIGTTEYLSATLYRYATVDAYHLCENLGSQKAATKAVEAFLEAFVKSMPTGKQNSFANRTLPSAVIMQIRDTQPVSLVGAFEKPVYANGDESVTEVACKRLVAQENAINQAFGVAPQQTYITCGAPLVKEALEGMEGTFVQLDEAIAGVSEQVAAYLTNCGYSVEN